MGGRNGLPLSEFLRLSDRQIAALLSVEFDDKGRLVRERERARQSDPAWRLPSAESLGMPEDAPAMKEGVTHGYAAMYWQVWRNRGLSPEETMQRWREHLASEN